VFSPVEAKTGPIFNTFLARVLLIGGAQAAFLRVQPLLR
jgi:hypothetical protein